MKEIKITNRQQNASDNSTVESYNSQGCRQNNFSSNALGSNFFQWVTGNDII